jgi:Leucine-rich repeat (LRR) protein
MNNVWSGYFVGPLPTTLNSLRNLTYLSIAGHERLNGGIPFSFANLPNLRYLNMSQNNLTGSIPSDIGSATMLQTVDLSRNLISGSIPTSISTLTQAKTINFNSNRLTGTLPPLQMTSLVIFDVANNPSLTVTLAKTLQPDCPIAIGLYRALGGSRFLAANASNACCGWNGIECESMNPYETWWMSSERFGLNQEQRIVKISWIRENLRGRIPASVGNFPYLRSLSLSDNQITDVIPPSFGNLSNLQVLELNGNRISGRIPATIGSLQKLTRLSFSDNLLNGAITSALNNLTQLLSLELKKNQFSGAVPNLSSLQSLINLELDNNMLTGSIPTQLGNLPALLTLTLNDNLLAGAIPTELGNLRAITSLSLSNNKLTGAIPSQLSLLSELQFLYLDSNMLTGAIPSTFGSLTKLRQLFVANNQLSGQVPSGVGSLTLLLALRLENNFLTGVPSSLSLLTEAKRVLLPNPMTLVPYDLVSQNPSFTLNASDWASFLGVTPLKKRQLLSSTASLTADQLYQMCPLNDVTNPDVPAGCISGIYNKYCVAAKTNDAALAQCQSVYDQVFAVSIFKSIGEVCPAWKKGPFSAECALAIRNFKYDLSYMIVTSTHAMNLNKNILAQPVYAPCRNTTTIKCVWT